MSLLRWLPTFLAFPLGGFLAMQTIGSADDPVAAGLGGLLVGAIVGLAQWLALRSQGTGPGWAVTTAVGTAVGSAAAVAVTGGSTTVPALVTMGLVTGAIAGAAQGTQLGRGRLAAALWAAVVSLSWGAGWLVTANVIVDAERGFHMFGSSGALTATVISGLVLRVLLRDATATVRPSAAAAPVGSHS
jgi:hypothetical protein